MEDGVNETLTSDLHSTLELAGSVAASNAAALVAGTLNGIEIAGTLQGDGVGVGITSTGSVGYITNTGAVYSRIGVYNMGTVTGSIANTGTIAGAIVNYGRVGGNVALGDNTTFVIAGCGSSVAGRISWNGREDLKAGHGDTVAVGDDEDLAAARTNGYVAADFLTVGAGSTLTVTRNNDWHVLSGDDGAITNNGTVVLNSDSDLTGNVTNNGMLTLSIMKSASATVTGNVDNGGSIVLNPASHSAGNTLTINGNYTGEAGSSVSLGGVLAGDDSLTDKVYITGDTAGTSALNIANENGSGAQTLEGIQVVQVDGNSAGTYSDTEGGLGVKYSF